MVWFYRNYHGHSCQHGALRVGLGVRRWVRRPTKTRIWAYPDPTSACWCMSSLITDKLWCPRTKILTQPQKFTLPGSSGDFIDGGKSCFWDIACTTVTTLVREHAGNEAYKGTWEHCTSALESLAFQKTAMDIRSTDLTEKRQRWTESARLEPVEEQLTSDDARRLSLRHDRV